MNMEQALQTFFDESRDLLEDMERILLEVEADDTTAEQLNALFRAMHTIKGSAGLFALEEIVRFTHQVENVLDQLRSGTLRLDDVLTGLLLRCHDHVQALLAAAGGGEAVSTQESEALLAELLTHVEGRTGTAAPVEAPVPAARAADAPERRWVMSLRFGADLLRNGMDPASFLRYLQTLGRIEQIRGLTVNLPVAEAFDPEACYLRFEALFAGAVTREALLDAFEFAREGSRILIFDPADAAGHLALAVDGLGDAEAAAVREAWRSLGMSLTPEDGAAPAVPAAASGPAAAPAPAGEGRQTKPAESKFIKVEAWKLDNLIDLIGELVIAGAAASLVAHRSGQPQMVEATLSISSLVEQIRAGTLSMRMIQIGEIFHRFPRVVRDVSRELDKAIELHVTGAETELDKSMVDKLGDPLMHIVRNAIDHGIEAPEVRRAKGKPECGNVWLNAYHESGSVVIEVADDGAGLDPQRLLAKAVERGMVPPDVPLPEAEIYKLIFEPGFSTARAVTNLSGRGVGMDVVRKSLDQLRGSIDIDSVIDQGTTFRIRLPLTLAIIDGFLVQVGSAVFVLPLETVIECMELPHAEEGPQDHLNLRGEILPLLRLASFFELASGAGKRQNVVVARFGERKAGLVVDALLGEFQTVIKPLGSLFRHLKAVSGSTILGNGEVALILDVNALIQVATQKEVEQFSLQAERARRGRGQHPAEPVCKE